MNFDDQELHLMCDLETLGRKPGCKVLSIGVATFGLGGWARERFYYAITRASQDMYGLTEEPETLAWWQRQSDEAKVSAFSDPCASNVETVLDLFARWVKHLQDTRRVGAKKTYLWGNGATFDNAILAELYDRVGVPRPWLWYNDRCYRTFKALAPHITIPPESRELFHHALDDANVQATHAVLVAKYLKGIADGRYTTYRAAQDPQPEQAARVSSGEEVRQRSEEARLQDPEDERTRAARLAGSTDGDAKREGGVL